MEFDNFLEFIKNIEINENFKNLLMSNTKQIYEILFEKIFHKIDVIEFYSFMKIITKLMFNLDKKNSINSIELIDSCIEFITFLLEKIDFKNKDEIMLLLKNYDNSRLFCLYYINKLETKFNCFCFSNFFKLTKDLKELYDKNLLVKK